MDDAGDCFEMSAVPSMEDTWRTQVMPVEDTHVKDIKEGANAKDTEIVNSFHWHKGAGNTQASLLVWLGCFLIVSKSIYKKFRYFRYLSSLL